MSHMVARGQRNGHAGACFVVFSLLAAPRPVAAAEPASAEAKAGAVQLFDEAERLVASGRFAEACPKYAESNRLDAQLGVLLYLADCYEKNGQLASAWASFRSATEIAEQRGDARAGTARARALALAPRVSRLVIEVPVAARVPGIVVKRDGTVVASTVWGSPVAVDAGEHVVRVSAPAYLSQSAKVAVTGEGQEARFVVAPLTPEPKAPSPLPAPGGPQAPGDPGSGQRIAALGLGGLGLVGVGVGGFFGLSAQSSESDSNALCNARNVCTPEGDDLRQKAKSRALVATIATVAGGAALVGAGVLWFTAPASPVADEKSQGARPTFGVALGGEGASLWARDAF